MVKKNIVRKILITDGTLKKYTEQRYVRQRSRSYHEFVQQQAVLIAVKQDLKKLLKRINEPEILVDLIQSSDYFSAAGSEENLIFSHDFPVRNHNTVFLIINQLIKGSVCGLSHSLLLSPGTPLNDFRGLKAQQQIELIEEVKKELSNWATLFGLIAVKQDTSKSYSKDEQKQSTKSDKKLSKKTGKNLTIGKLKVVISIDFEWTSTQLKNGLVRKFGDVLSGQYAMFFPDYPTIDIHGIVFNDSSMGFNFRSFMMILVDRIQDEFNLVKDGVIVKLDLKQLNILLTGFFLGVDFSALTGWNKLSANLIVIDKQKIFSNRPYNFTLRHKLEDAGLKVSMTFRDTSLLAPVGGLKVLGEIVGHKKLDTSVFDRLDHDSGLITDQDYHDGLEKGGYYKSNMDVFLANRPHEYAQYALGDAIVALSYLKTVMSVYKLSWEDFNDIPPTTSSYAMKNIAKSLEHEHQDQRIFDPKYSFSEIKESPESAVRDQYRDLYQMASKAYFGGFNVAFSSIVGQAKIVDLDLSSAYNVSGRLMPCPNYSKPLVLNDLGVLFEKEVMLNENSNTTFEQLYQLLKKAKGFPFVMGICQASFSFPSGYESIVTIPQRSPKTDNPVYVLNGKDTCLTLIDAINAFENGAQINYKMIIIPSQSWDSINVWSDEQSRFLALRQKAKKQRDSSPIDSPSWRQLNAMQLLYKLAGNVVYGKSAQSVRIKKTRDYMTNRMTEIDISRITDPLVAGMYTAITRYLAHHLYDAVASIYKDKVIGLNITTDGYSFALIDDVSYDFDAINAAFNSRLPDYYRMRIAKVGYKAGFERKGDQTDKLTRFYNTRTRLNGTVDVESLNAMGGIYYSSNDTLIDKVKQIYQMLTDGKIDLKSETNRMSNLTEMKFGSRNHAQGLMFNWTTPVRIPLQYDCAYRPDEWIGNKIVGFGFSAKPFNTIEQHDEWKSHSKILTERWNIMRSQDQFNTYLQTMAEFSFKKAGKTLDDPLYQQKAIYIFNRLQGIQQPVNPLYRNDWTRMKAAIRVNKKLPVCRMAVYKNQKVDD